MGCPVVHFEMWAQDPGRVAGFYREVFGWTIREIPELRYHLVEPAGERGIGGGIMKPQEGPCPAKLTVYIDVEEIAPYRERIVAAGGRMLVEEMEVPGVGWLALFEDPEGRVLGLWKQRPQG